MSFAKFINVLVALVFIVTGTVLLLGNLGYLSYDAFELLAKLWPIILILLGLYFLLIRLRPARRPREEDGLNDKRGERIR